MRLPSTPTRRKFLSATGVAGLAAVAPNILSAKSSAAGSSSARSCIFINLVGGPGHLDTFDPKPGARVDDRGPFRPIRTRVPGTLLSELFPQMAAIADMLTLVRGMSHQGPPVHEAGLQMLNTGRLFRDGPEWPGVGAVLSNLHGDDFAWWMMRGRPIDAGLSVSVGQSAGFLTASPHSPVEPWKDALTQGRGRPSFSMMCQHARDVIESGARSGSSRFITINMFDTVFNEPSWDCHADYGSLGTTLGDIRDTVAPTFDSAFATLLTELDQRGLLESTLVIATGEFGRTPWFNSNGGRDHWANAWTSVVAGGGTKGGRIIGATDRTGAEVVARPTSPQNLVASIFHSLGIARNATIPGPEGRPVAVAPADPILELFE